MIVAVRPIGIRGTIVIGLIVALAVHIGSVVAGLQGIVVARAGDVIINTRVVVAVGGPIIVIGLVACQRIVSQSDYFFDTSWT